MALRILAYRLPYYCTAISRPLQTCTAAHTLPHTTAEHAPPRVCCAMQTAIHVLANVEMCAVTGVYTHACVSLPQVCTATHLPATCVYCHMCVTATCVYCHTPSCHMFILPHTFLPHACTATHLLAVRVVAAGTHEVGEVHDAGRDRDARVCGPGQQTSRASVVHQTSSTAQQYSKASVQQSASVDHQ